MYKPSLYHNSLFQIQEQTFCWKLEQNVKLNFKVVISYIDIITLTFFIIFFYLNLQAAADTGTVCSFAINSLYSSS